MSDDKVKELNATTARVSQVSIKNAEATTDPATPIRIAPKDWPGNVMSGLEVWDALPLCGCGAPDEVVVLYAWILAAFESEHTDLRWQFFEALEEIHVGMFFAVLYSLDDADLTEHGMGVRSGWLTEDGKRIHRFLCAFGTDTDVWPGGEERHGNGPWFIGLSEKQHAALEAVSGRVVPKMETHG